MNHITKQFSFPCGEPHLQLTNIEGEKLVNIDWEFTGSKSIIELMLYSDALTRMHVGVAVLTIPYVPFSRQDRVNTPGEPLSLAVMAKIINDIQARYVVITDPHSDVTPALIHNCVVVPQHTVFGHYFPYGDDRVLLVSPDGGALKKIYKLATPFKLPVLECSKIRNTETGEITGTYVPPGDILGATCVIVDDICDGGRTFVELAKALRERGVGKVTLMVTHGFFTKGLQVFDGLIDEIYTRTGRVK